MQTKETQKVTFDLKEYLEKQFEKIDDDIKILNRKIDDNNTELRSNINLLNQKIDTNMNVLNTKIDTNMNVLNTKTDTNMNVLNTKIDIIQNNHLKHVQRYLFWLITFVISGSVLSIFKDNIINLFK